MSNYFTGSNEELKAKLEVTLKHAKDIARKAQEETRDLTAVEEEELGDLLQKSDDLKSVIEAQQNKESMLETIKNIGGGQYGAEVSTAKNAEVWAKRSALKVRAKVGEVNGKSLVASGSTVVGLPQPAPIAKDTPVNSLLQLVPEKASGPAYSFLQQTARTFGSDTVAPGTQKPTGTYTLTTVTGLTQVVAVLSQPVDIFQLGDNDGLARFLQSEMLADINATLDLQLLSGGGTAPDFRGLLNTSGILTTAFDTSILKSIRKALNTMEKNGTAVNGIVMHHDTFMALEMTAGTNQDWLLGTGPLDATARRLYGIPVILSTNIATTTALIGDFSGSCALLVSDPVRLDWSDAVVGSVAGVAAFASNENVARLEMRANLAVYKPAAFNKVTLA